MLFLKQKHTLSKAIFLFSTCLDVNVVFGFALDQFIEPFDGPVSPYSCADLDGERRRRKMRRLGVAREEHVLFLFTNT